MTHYQTSIKLVPPLLSAGWRIARGRRDTLTLTLFGQGSKLVYARQFVPMTLAFGSVRAGPDCPPDRTVVRAGQKHVPYPLTHWDSFPANPEYSGLPG